MYISFVWHPEYRQCGWSIGYCDSCQQQVVVRLEDVVHVCYVWGIFPCDERRAGKGARCDFCLRRVDSVQDRRGLALEDWSPEEGLPGLLPHLNIRGSIVLPKTASDTQLHALLTSVQKASSLSNVELSPLGICLGIPVGIFGAIPLARWLYETDKVEMQIDETGFVIRMCMVGGVVGLILGATVETLIRRDRSTFSRIESTYRKYRIDLDRLEELSRGYSRRIRKAVNQVRAKVARMNFGDQTR